MVKCRLKYNPRQGHLHKLFFFLTEDTVTGILIVYVNLFICFILYMKVKKHVIFANKKKTNKQTTPTKKKKRKSPKKQTKQTSHSYLFFSSCQKVNIVLNNNNIIASSHPHCWDHGKMPQYSSLSHLLRHDRTLCQRSSIPFSLASPWSTPWSPAIDASLQDVSAEVQGPDDMAKVLQLSPPYGFGQLPLWSHFF